MILSDGLRLATFYLAYPRGAKDCRKQSSGVMGSSTSSEQQSAHNALPQGATWTVIR
jgi:hypothetical protein